MNHQNALLKGIACIGPCFLLMTDTYELKFLEVGEGSLGVIGYTPEEIIQTGWDFHFQIVHPEDLQQCLQMIKTAWDFLEAVPLHSKLNHVINFYYRAIKKDGTVIKLQHQVINLELDKSGNILLAGIILTDVSHLGLSHQVKLSIVNPKNNTCFSANAQHPQLICESTVLSKREAEILKLLTKGYNSREIAEKLVISYFTVRTHRKNILEKLGKKNTAEMISYTLSHGLI